MRLKPILTLTLLALLIFFVGTIIYAAVEINYFQVNSWEGNVVTLEWETASEQDIAGFYVWRSDTNVLISDIGDNPEEQGLVKLNTQPIVNEEAGGCNAGSSKTYTYPDKTVADEQDVYYYYLQAIKCLSNTQEFYEESTGGAGLQAIRPGSVTPTPTATATSSDFVLHLPLIMRSLASH